MNHMDKSINNNNMHLCAVRTDPLVPDIRRSVNNAKYLNILNTDHSRGSAENVNRQYQH